MPDNIDVLVIHCLSQALIYGVSVRVIVV